MLKQAINSIIDPIRILISYPHDGQHLGLSAYLAWHFRHAKRLQKFKDIHKNKSCFIIGNGPSLNKMDLTPLKDYYTFGLNKIYLMFDRVDLNLSYHVAVNPLVIEQSQNEFKSLSCPSFLSYRPAYRLFTDMKVDHIFYVFNALQWIFQADIPKGISDGYTVTYVAMQIAFYMGFEKVYLIGVDHNFQVSGAPNEKQFLKGKDPNHFDPNYFSHNEWQLPDLEASELSYRLAKFHYQRAGKEIYDATVGGKLNIFPKISYEDALQKCSQIV